MVLRVYLSTIRIGSGNPRAAKRIDALPQQVFTLSQPAITSHLNRYWDAYGMRPGPVYQYDWKDGPIHPSVFWFEWNAMVVAWNQQRPDAHALQQTLFRSVKVNGMNATDTQADGYLWPETTNPRWFGRQYHFDHLPRFLCGLYRYVVWTKNTTLLHDIMPIARRVMGYLWHTMDGQHGVVRCPGNNTGLPDTGEVSTYMDCTRSGYVDGWINAGWYLALEHMAQLELMSGRPKVAARYRRARQNTCREFNRRLWNPSTRRYAGWQDITGRIHDSGYTYVNLEALANGLACPERAAHIMDWLDNGRAQPAVQGAHKGSTDIYRMVVAPVTNTIRIPNEDWDPWSHVNRNRLGDAYEFGYGNHVTDGGTMLWINYYDVMARLRWQSADMAYYRWTRMLERCAADSRFLRFGLKGAADWRNVTDFGEHFLGLGTDYDFPESGISATSLLTGFLGVNADIHGISVSPNLPNALVYACVHGVTHGNRTMDISAARAHIISEYTPGLSARTLRGDGLLTAQVHSPQTFDQVGVFLEADLTHGGMVAIQLDRLNGGKRTCVAAQYVPVVHRSGWCYLSLPPQSPGRYLLSLRAIGCPVQWVCAVNGSDFAVQIVQCCHQSGAWRMHSSHSPEWTAGSPFSRVVGRLLQRNHAPVTLNLERRMGERWMPVSECQLFRADPDGCFAIDMATQPAGRYRLQTRPRTRLVVRDILSTRYIVSVTDTEKTGHRQDG